MTVYIVWKKYEFNPGDIHGEDVLAIYADYDKAVQLAQRHPMAMSEVTEHKTDIDAADYCGECREDCWEGL